jgi:hypothetical protein
MGWKNRTIKQLNVFTYLVETRLRDHLSPMSSTLTDDLAAIFDRDPPENLIRLFSITKKSELEKYARDLVVTRDELFRMIVAAGKAGYHHQPAFQEIQPDDIQPTKEEIDSFRKGPSSDERAELRIKMMRKMRQMFKVRKIVAFHLFVSPTRWHLISFTQHDATETKENHWKAGPHIHFVNDLWPNLTIVAACKGFPERPNGLHIRFDNGDND